MYDLNYFHSRDFFYFHFESKRHSNDSNYSNIVTLSCLISLNLLRLTNLVYIHIFGCVISVVVVASSSDFLQLWI